MKKTISRLSLGVLMLALVIFITLFSVRYSARELAWVELEEELLFFTIDGEVGRVPYDANEYGAGRYYIYTSLDMHCAAFIADPISRDGSTLYRIDSRGVTAVAENVRHAVLSDDVLYFLADDAGALYAAWDGKAELLLNAAKGNYGYIQIYRLDGKSLVRHQYCGDDGLWSADYYIVTPRGLKLILNVEACVRDEMSVYEMSWWNAKRQEHIAPAVSLSKNYGAQIDPRWRLPRRFAPRNDK